MAQEPDNPMLSVSAQPDALSALHAQSDTDLATTYWETRSQDVFAEIVRRNQQFAYRVAFANCGNAALAEEIVQEAFIQLLRVRADFTRSPFRSWFFGLVSNVAKHHSRIERRKSARTKSLRFKLEAENMNAARQESVQATGFEDERNAITAVLATLDPSHRVPLVLHYIEGLTQDEVGKLMGVSQSMVARRLAQGLEILRLRLVQSGVVAGGLALPQALSQGLLSPSPALQEALASEQFRQLAVAGVKHSVRRARHAFFQTGRSGSGALWIVVSGALLAAVVIAAFSFRHEEPAPLFKAQNQSSPDATLESTALPAKPASASTKPELQATPLKWSFEDAPPQEPLQFSGNWQWGPSKWTGKHILMSAGERTATYLRLPLKPAIGRAARIKIRFKPVLVLPVCLWPLWGSDKETIPHTSWAIEMPDAIDTKLIHNFTIYVHGSWAASIGKEGVISVFRSETIDSKASLMLSLVNAALLDLTYEEIPVEALPESVLHPEKLIEGKQSKIHPVEPLNWRPAKEVLVQGLK